LSPLDAPLMAIRRGFIASGISRTSSVLPPSIVITFCSAVIEISSGEKPATASVIW
jgi:hypothetical protein